VGMRNKTMSANFNQAPLTDKRQQLITTRLVHARDHVVSMIERRGGVDSFVNDQVTSLDELTWGNIAAIADGAFPDGIGERMHPKATAIEQGLVVGFAIAKRVLRAQSAITFEEDFSEHLYLTHEKLHTTSSSTGYDFDQHLALTGRRMADQLGDIPLPARSSHPKIDADKNRLFSDAVGYVVGMATTVLCTEALAAQNRLPGSEQRAMEDEASAAYRLKPQDFDIPPNESDAAL